MADILFVTWDGGGNVPPALGIAAELQARGHAVRVLGHAGQQPSLDARPGSTSRPCAGRAGVLGRRRATHRSR